MTLSDVGKPTPIKWKIDNSNGVPSITFSRKLPNGKPTQDFSVYFFFGDDNVFNGDGTPAPGDSNQYLFGFYEFTIPGSKLQARGRRGGGGSRGNAMDTAGWTPGITCGRSCRTAWCSFVDVLDVLRSISLGDAERRFTNWWFWKSK